MFNKFVRELLYVPYNKDFDVCPTIKASLTIPEFFENCCVIPSFLMNDTSEASTQEYTENITADCIHDACRLKDWLGGSGNGLFTITGDAGTGKSTLLHYFQYSNYGNRNSKLMWEIVDIQKATTLVNFFGQRIAIPRFVTLHGKVVSTLINNCLLHLFTTLNPRKNDLYSVANSIKNIFFSYAQSDIVYQSKELVDVFTNSKLWKKIVNENQEPTIDDLNDYAKHLVRFFTLMLNSPSDEEQLFSILNLYRTLLAAKHPNKQFVIAFDNLERFIGNHEIHNEQIERFARYVRQCFDIFSNEDIGSGFGIRAVMFVRNTTARMLHPPQQLADHPGHDLDMSSWIPIAEIVDRKREWYAKHNIKTQNIRCIDKILGSNCFDKDSSDTLQSRLENLFNRNNRILLEILVRAITNADIAILNKFDELSEGIEYKRFAARSIIIRIVLDELSRDQFFTDIATQNNKGVATRLGYARKILTILHHYQIDGHGGYMPFIDFLKTFEMKNGGEIESYFDNNSQERRITISHILFHMNYYNVRKKNWLQFIDIQYSSSEETVQVENQEQMFNLIENNYDKIGLRITNAGRTYLKHIIQSFEFFSCRLSGNKTKPLVCTIPTKTELAQNSVNELECIKIIKRVSDDMNTCIKIMKLKSDVDIPYRSKREAQPQSHAVRIVESYRNFINRFKNFVEQEYDKGNSLSDTERINYQKLIATLENTKQYVQG